MEPWLDRVARRLARGSGAGTTGLERVATALADGAEGPAMTRRHALKAAAAGAVALGPAAAVLAQEGSCLGPDPVCLSNAESAFETVTAGCAASPRQAGSLWSELRCHAGARRDRARARIACRVPLDTRCPPGTVCSPDGACLPAPGTPQPQPTAPPGPQPPPIVSPCGDDTPTPESVAAARAALAAGATDVALSPGGCLRYRRTLSAGEVVADEVVAGSARVRAATYAATAADGTIDFNYDGVADERMSYRLTAGAVTVEEVLLEQLAPGGAVVARQRRTLRSDAPNTVHIVHEEPHPDTGELVRREWDDVPNPETGGGRRATRRRAAACTAAQESAIRSALAQCVSQGIPCQKSHGAPHRAEAMSSFAARVQFECDTALDLVAHADGAWNPFWRPGSPTITVNPDNLAKQSAAGQAASLCHELQHFAEGMFSAHSPAVSAAPPAQRNTIDPVYACGELCFGSAPTRCHCARCLRTHKCAPACAAYADCNPDLGAECGCPCRYKVYPTRTQCEVECPSGLCCFAFRCFPFDVSCP
jgi:hypothetical protein